MVYFPCCKINLGLHVLSKRPDGYHAIETCYFPVPWTDMLEIIPAEEFSFASSGLLIPGAVEDNLCVQAYRLLATDFKISPVQVYLHKNIPVGAGLGGGSSDAAYTLQALDEIFSLKITSERLNDYAAQLGSDVNFFLASKPALASGRGEMLNSVRVDLHRKFLVIIIPDIHISTAEAYQSVTPRDRQSPLIDMIRKPLNEWRDQLANDFETSVFRKYPLIENIKDKLYSLGAMYASMSGSGSSVFGLFDHRVDIRDSFSGMHFWAGELE